MAKYRPILTRLLDDEKPLAYGRVIDYDLESGNSGEARRLLEEAAKRGIFPSVNNPEARSLQAKIETEAAEAKTLLARREEEAKNKAAVTTLKDRVQGNPERTDADGEIRDQGESEPEVYSYKIKRGWASGTIKVEIPSAFGIEFSDFERSGSHLNYTVLWHSSKNRSVNPQKMRWIAYDSKGVNLEGFYLDVGNTIRSGEPTKGNMIISDDLWKKAAKIKIIAE